LQKQILSTRVKGIGYSLNWQDSIRHKGFGIVL
jgi:hypothetical protein